MFPGEFKRNPRIVAFGGGTGMASLLAGVKRYTDAVTAVVTVTDDGGSSGRLRKDFGIAPPGDIRNCLIALADRDSLLARLFQYRFVESELKGHSFGNLFIAALARVTGSMEEAIRQVNRILSVQGRVLPASAAKVSLVAEHPDGSKSTGEVEISRSGKPIHRISLRPRRSRPPREVLDAIGQADLAVFGPGSLYTSVVPHLLMEGVVDALLRRGCPRVYVSNLMTQTGETPSYSASDHVAALRRHAGEEFPDHVVVHVGTIPELAQEGYRREGAAPVVLDHDRLEAMGVQVIAGDLASVGRVVRHDPARLACLLMESFFACHGRRA